MQNTTAEKTNEDSREWEVIHAYSRAEAIQDGVLADLTALFPNDTRLFKYPVACTAAVWNLIERACERTGDNPGGYVWDLCWMAIHTGKTVDPATRIFKCSIPLPGRQHTFKIVCGPGDDLEPVLTIMFPNED